MSRPAARSTGPRPIVLGALAAFGPLSIDFYLPALPGLTREMGGSATLGQLTVVACFLGLGVGQVALGSLSDRVGRRPPLMIGITLFAVASIACAAAPSLPPLIAARFVQGVGGAGGLVIGRAIARDTANGRTLARTISTLVMVASVAPVAAPVVGGLLTPVIGWRGVFCVLAALGTVLLVVSIVAVPETRHPPQRGHASGAWLRSVAMLLHDRVFLGAAGVLAITAASFMTYLTMSSFVFQQAFAADSTGIAIVFATNAFGMLLGAQTNRLLAARFSAARLLLCSLAGGTGGAVLIAISPMLGSWSAHVGLVAVLYFQGWTNPNTFAVALDGHGPHAGTASSLLGVAQLAIGPAVAPLVSLFGVSVVVLGITMLVALALAAGVAGIVIAPPLRRDGTW